MRAGNREWLVAAVLALVAGPGCQMAPRGSPAGATGPERDPASDWTAAFHPERGASESGGSAPSAAARGAESELQLAVDATRPGDTLVVYGGHYRGSLRLERPIALVGRDLPILDGEGAGDVVTIEAGGVTLEGFRVRYSGLDLARNEAAVKVHGDGARIRNNLIGRSLHGIYLEGANGALVEDNEIAGFDSLASPDRGNGIHLWNARRNVLRGNRVSATRDGLYFAGSPSNTIADNVVERTRIGLHYMYSDSNVFSNNVFRANEAGAAIMLSRALDVSNNRFVQNVGHRAYGLLLQTADDSRVRGNEIEGNTVGLFFDNSNRNQIVDNRVVGNFLGVHLYASSENNAFSGNAFGANEHDLVNDGGVDENDWSPGGRGNFWEAQRGYDLNGDGTADEPYRVVDVYSALIQRVPSAVLFTRSPAMDALALAERLFPAFQTSSAVDGHPLQAPPSVDTIRRMRPRATGPALPQRPAQAGAR
jgi:nitrous oxidase accessory protein